MKPIKSFIFAFLVVSFSCLANSGLGFGADVSVEGFLNPTIKQFKIIEVHSGSSADLAGVKVGQQVLEIDGCVIPGCSANKAKKIMNKKAGEVLRLRVKNLNGSEENLHLLGR